MAICPKCNAETFSVPAIVREGTTVTNTRQVVPYSYTTSSSESTVINGQRVNVPTTESHIGYKTVNNTATTRTYIAASLALPNNDQLWSIIAQRIPFPNRKYVETTGKILKLFSYIIGFILFIKACILIPHIWRWVWGLFDICVDSNVSLYNALGSFFVLYAIAGFLIALFVSLFAIGMVIVMPFIIALLIAEKIHFTMFNKYFKAMSAHQQLINQGINHINEKWHQLSYCNNCNEVILPNWNPVDINYMMRLLIEDLSRQQFVINTKNYINENVYGKKAVQS